jgi:hypothetical protein
MLHQAVGGGRAKDTAYTRLRPPVMYGRMGTRARWRNLPGGEDEVAFGENDPLREVRAETVSCPYDNCGQQVEVMWPKGQPLRVREIPSEM